VGSFKIFIKIMWGLSVSKHDGGCFVYYTFAALHQKTKGVWGTYLKTWYRLCKTVCIYDASKHGAYLGGPLPYPYH